MGCVRANDPIPPIELIHNDQERGLLKLCSIYASGFSGAASPKVIYWVAPAICAASREYATLEQVVAAVYAMAVELMAVAGVTVPGEAQVPISRARLPSRSRRHE